MIDGHRWLAASGCAWNLLGPNATGSERQDSIIVDLNIEVMVLSSLLLHARFLIDFYTNGKPKRPRGTDILLRDFIQLTDWENDVQLQNYRKSIELHLLHLTDYRDDSFRSNNPKTKDGLPSARLDWNLKASVMAQTLIFTCLKCTSQQSGDWQDPFKALFDATEARYQDKSYNWPKDLGEQSDVAAYLTGLGL